MARRGFVTRGRRQVRDTLWFGMAETVTTIASANGAAIMLSLNAAALALRPFTIVRTVGYFAVRSDQTAANEIYDAAVGYAVVSDQSVAIGVTAVPTPWTDLGSDLWFVHQMKMDRFMFISGIGVENSQVRGWQYESKAMRKVENGQDVIVVGESSSLGNGCVIHYAARMLIKLN